MDEEKGLVTWAIAIHVHGLCHGCSCVLFVPQQRLIGVMQLPCIKPSLPCNLSTETKKTQLLLSIYSVWGLVEMSKLPNASCQAIGNLDLWNPFILSNFQYSTLATTQNMFRNPFCQTALHMKGLRLVFVPQNKVLFFKVKPTLGADPCRFAGVLASDIHENRRSCVALLSPHQWIHYKGAQRAFLF